MELAGPALPVRCPPGDNLVLHHALAGAAPGDVLVVDVGSGRGFGYWGDILSSAAQRRRLGGLVITGGVRDTERLKVLGLPVFSATVAIRGTIKDPGAAWSIGEPLTLGDATIRQGDLVRGDADGLVVIPRADLDTVLAEARRREDHEADVLARIAAGETTLEIYGFPQLLDCLTSSQSARVSVDVVGLSHGALPIPAASRVGFVIATGGVRGVDRATGVLPTELADEVRFMFSNLRAVVEEAGGKADDVVKVTIWTSVADARAFINDEWVKLFPNPRSRPARHLLNYALPGGMKVQCEALAIAREF